MTATNFLAWTKALAPIHLERLGTCPQTSNSTNLGEGWGCLSQLQPNGTQILLSQEPFTYMSAQKQNTRCSVLPFEFLLIDGMV